MNCPKCNAAMELVRYGGLEIDRCTNCKGLWFAGLEKEIMEKLEGSEVIDVGDPDVGEEYDKTDRYSCPECSGAMVRMVDVRQPHIHFEQCSVCYGTFFDAGEFKDLKERTIADMFRDWLSEERR